VKADAVRELACPTCGAKAGAPCYGRSLSRAKVRAEAATSRLSRSSLLYCAGRVAAARAARGEQLSDYIDPSTNAGWASSTAKHDPIMAVALLRRHAIADGTPTEVGAAIGELLDHLANVEMVVSLIRGGYESAFRHAPEFAIIGAGKKRV
jgi:hypothetical protein